jgi:DNA-binding CsgD family transcriptional regulator
MAESNELSERERQILYLVATGASNKEIAQTLFISTNTVKVHLRNIFSKIGATSRTEAAMIAVRMGIVSPHPPIEEHKDIESHLEGELSKIESATPFERQRDERKVSISPYGIGFAILLLFLLIGFAGWLYGRGERVTAQPSNNPRITEVGSRWQEEPEIPTPRSGAAITAYENKIYVIAGNSNLGVTGVVERYDPAKKDWVSLDSKPIPVADVSAVVVGGQIYVPGGRTQTGEPTSVMEIYDPNSNTWKQGTPLPEKLSGYAVVAFEGKVYLFGGWDGEQFVNSVFIYDPSQDKWLRGSDMPTARGYAGAVSAGGRIYVIGGYDGTNALTVNEIYTPERDDGLHHPWEKGAAMPIGRYGMGITSIADIIYIVGGEGVNWQDLPPLEYSPQFDRWQQLQNPFSFQWSKLGLISMETHLYALGGTIEGAPSGKNVSYQVIYTISIPLVR